MKVAVVGTGYVGLVTGVVLADLGNDVICVDNNEEKLAKLKQGIPPIFEPGIEQILRRVIADGFISFTNCVSEATSKSEVVYIAVGTPPLPDGNPDLSAVQAVAKEIAKGISGYTVVVNKSTVPVGSGDMVENIILDQGVPSSMFDVVSNPEFLREGSAIHDSMNPDRIVIGAKRREAATKLLELYATMGAPTIVTDLNSAELIKYASNSFLAMKISFINAVSRLCELCSADVADVSRGMGLDQRIGKQFLQAGLGWGGSCFPKDIRGLIATADNYGYEFGLLEQVVQVNKDQTQNVLNRLRQRLGGFAGKRVALLGLSFKPNTDDIRDAKSLEIISTIQGEGGKVNAYDPVSMPMVREIYPEVCYVEHVYDVGMGADALILVTEWNEFRHLDWDRIGAKMNQRVLFDGRRAALRQVVERCGFEYFTVGSR